ncbi:MAG: carbamoyl-phosphate synthase (glutamine-hydrolyzing) large subunit [Burkholderiales bacterium]|jgi:carbamoyl-phosphate synthase large subunit|nr:carbamoyl-phosphate synthase (glutamine-hydrolyzing) large subunit [Burkholderiales bacterium]MBP9768129.1 carbamoyl-phosphate synthase (glutamine-hydrolyzing) large subunit [Burkholderiales bacterium]
MKNILLLGSGGLRVGQAGEFDYSGSQAIKAFKEEGYRVILVNPNIATVQTDQSMADEIYFVPLQQEFVAPIIAKEQINYIALGFGGQTALNLGLELHHSGILAKHNVQVLGSSVTTIEATEDRDIFRDYLEKNAVKTPKSKSATSVAEAIAVGQEFGYPLMLRAAFSLGGLGSGKVFDEADLIDKAGKALSGAPQVLLEEYLTGWKEFEYEIVRDLKGNSLTICNMENLDPMGIHTGESIVIAPAQTLNDEEHQNLRNISLRCAEIFNIVGECNIQFSVNPANGDYRVIEMNPRLSRSSALASKATGYPLAFVAAKLCLGFSLNQLTNQVTKKTTAFFEPALDYVVVKIPRWDTHKLRLADRHIGTEMKSVGEVMGIGRTFPEALQKAVQMLNIGASSLHDYLWPIHDLRREIEFATDRRIFALYKWFYAGGDLYEAQQLSRIDFWFLNQIKQIAEVALQVKHELTPNTLRTAKQFGFSDKSLATLTEQAELTIRHLRHEHNIRPMVKQIDTLAGEFAAQTNYLYTTYHGRYHDISPAQEVYVIIGSGPYSIGSSVEFDWCTVNLARQLRLHGKQVIIINSNPETVSTDYDESDRLYFEPLSLERVCDILDFENVVGVCVSVGGQIANNLALPLHKLGYPILGTSPLDIDNAEDRAKFSSMLNELNIDQPRWINAKSSEEVQAFIGEVGLPVLIRPSYVLSGAAMKVVSDHKTLASYLSDAVLISNDHPVVISQFIENAKELEIDGIAQNGRIIIDSISEHVENAGVHSGDATLVFPPERLYLKTVTRARESARKIVKALNISGPFNMQFIAKNNELKVIECNVRSSRSFPFISKVTGQNLVELMAKVFLGEEISQKYNTLECGVIGVKSPVFSYNRFKGSDPVAQVEMSSTGEVACIGNDLLETFYMSWLGVGQRVDKKVILLSLDDKYKQKLLPLVKRLSDQGWLFVATGATHDLLVNSGIQSKFVFKISEQVEPNIQQEIIHKQVGLIINLPQDAFNTKDNSDGFRIRRLAIDYHIPLVTNFQLSEILLESLAEFYAKAIPVHSYRELLNGANHG